MMEHKKFDVNEQFDGIRLDQFLAAVLDCSRNRVQKLIDDGMISISNGKICAKRKVRRGEMVEVSLPETAAPVFEAEDIPLELVYQDEYFAVVNKPRGLAVHPGAGRASGTLVNALMHHLTDLSGIGGVERPGIVHRLDLDTSGLMVIAKNDAAHESLCEQFASRLVEKQYLALVHGRMKNRKGEIIAPIGRHRVNRKKMAVIEGGRYAHTLWQVEEAFEDFSFLKVNIMTGRTHQIRVHLAYIRHSVVGDALYGRKENPFGVDSQLLHAASISFAHPADGRKMEFSVPLPQDMAEALKFLRGEIN